MRKIRILSFVDYYLPGYKFGGVSRALASLVEHLGDYFEFRIITTNKDYKDTKPYPDIEKDTWVAIGKAKVCYLPHEMMTLAKIRSLILSQQPDIIYFNSFFSPLFTVKPMILRRLGLIKNIPVIIAPRGEFSPAALSLKTTKKRVFIFAAKMLGLYSNVIWQALSEDEVAYMQKQFGSRAIIKIAKDMISVNIGTNDFSQSDKVPGKLKLVFVSRISRIKNLLGALKIIQHADFDIDFDIYGLIEDQEYWNECAESISNMPANVKVIHHGGVHHEQVSSIFRSHDLFILPSFGEGSATTVLEAFAAGCPVLISDKTPYHNLEEIKAGWDIPLDKPELFLAALHKCAQMNSQVHNEWRKCARSYGQVYTDVNMLVAENRAFFESV